MPAGKGTVEIQGKETVSKASKQAGQSLNNLNNDVKKSQSFFSKHALAIGAVTAGLYVLKRGIDDAIQAYIQQEQAVTKLRAALQATNNAVGIGIDEMQDMAAELSNLTGVADEAIIEAQGLMTTFTQISGAVFPDAIEAAADMSAMFGQDLRQSVIQLGTALNDPIQGVGRLRRIGISFTQEQKDMIQGFVEANDIMSAQRVILDELDREFGGVAKAMGRTATGSLRRFNTTLGDLKELGGKAILDFMKPTIDYMTDIAREAGKALESFSNMKRILSESGWKEATKDIDSMKTALKELREREAVLSKNLSQGVQLWAGTLKQSQDELDEVRTKMELLAQAIRVKEEAMKRDKKTIEDTGAAYDELAAIARGEYIVAAAEIDKKAKLLGDSFDANAEKASVLKDIMIDLLEKGLEPSWPAMQQLVTWYRELTKETGELIVFEQARVAILEQQIDDQEKLINQLAFIDEKIKGLNKTTTEMEDRNFDLAASFEDLLMDGREWSDFLATELRDAYVESFQAIGEHLWHTEDGWRSLKEVAKDAIASILLMLSKQALVQAGLAFIPLTPQFSPAAGVALLAASAAAAAGAGFIKALRYGGVLTEPVVGVGLQTGTTYTMAEEGPETVTPMGGTEGMPLHITVILNDKPILNVVKQAVRNRDLIIRAEDLA